MTLVADEGCQIFGGRALTKTGMGRFMEGFQTSYKFAAILGGSEEIIYKRPCSFILTGIIEWKLNINCMEIG